MTSNGKFSTLPQQKQVELIHRFSTMYRGNERGYGWADPKGKIYDDIKCKWIFKKGCIGWKWGKVGEEEWLSHLKGEMMLGIGPLMDDGTVYWGCIDVDKVGEFIHYDFDVLDIISRAKSVCKEFVPIRSKSGGLHLFMHFDKPMDAMGVRNGLLQFSARIGIAGNEVFPKQTKLLVEEGDAPSWVFMPYFGS
jgi:hypothetical protein